MKKFIFLLAFCLFSGTICVRPIETYAYTEEEKQMAKEWLSAHGYPPTRSGAEQAYQDYLDGKFDDLLNKGGDDDLDDEPDEKPKKKKKKRIKQLRSLKQLQKIF